MKRLDIQTVKPRLEISTTNAQLQIKQKLRRFSTQKPTPQMQVERQNASFQVNWDKVWAESGRRSPTHLSQYINQLSKENVDRAIQSFVENGNYMANIHKYIGGKSNPIAELAWNEMMADMPEINVANMPESMPEIKWDPGYIKINWDIQDMQVEWDEDFMPDIVVTPHSVEIKISEYAEVRITVNEDSIPQAEGNKVNEQV